MKIKKINLQWSGPHSYNEVLRLDGDTDYGLYQIHAVHPVYGADTLAYIGKADEQTFAARLRSHNLMVSDDYAAWENNGCRIRIHTGRIHVKRNEDRPRRDTWSKWIARAEHLLIYAHSPAWNANFVMTPPKGRVYHDVHVLNWGQYGRLLPEVSGARFTNDAVFNRLNDDPLSSLMNRCHESSPLRCGRVRTHTGGPVRRCSCIGVVRRRRLPGRRRLGSLGLSRCRPRLRRAWSRGRLRSPVCAVPSWVFPPSGGEFFLPRGRVLWGLAVLGMRAGAQEHRRACLGGSGNGRKGSCGRALGRVIPLGWGAGAVRRGASWCAR